MFCQSCFQFLQRFTSYYQLARPLFRPGSSGWLIAHEIAFGGYVDRVPVRIASPFDSRTESQLANTTMAGGDRMLHHRYAGAYARYLEPFVVRAGPERESPERLTIVEVGTLYGTGLALWCELFPASRIIGLDIDTEPYYANQRNLRERGAFAHNVPELYVFDQLDTGPRNRERVSQLLLNERFDICIDDGLHSNRSILNTMSLLAPYLAERFLYVIEDNSGVHRHVRARYPQFKVESEGELTIVTPGELSK